MGWISWMENTIIQLDCNPLKAGWDAISDKTLIFP